MTREKILLILGAAGLVAVVFTIALLLGGNQGEPEPTPAPEPVVTIEPGTAPSATPTPTATTGPDEHFEGDGHDHDDEGHAGHDHGPVTDCETGPVGCDDSDVLRNTPEEVEAAATVKPRVSPFVLAWTAYDSDESAAARSARLTAAGATADVAAQVTVLARENTTLTGLTAKTTGKAPSRILFVGAQDGLLMFQASVDVDARYHQPDGSGSYRVIGGAIYVYLTADGKVSKVTESFPAINEMR